jgi:NifB/MoaA-like Fe-S oxidoreductase
MESLSVVPMGMTKYREGLVQVEKFTKEDAVSLLTQIEHWQEIFLNRYGIRFVHASDEWFLMADRPIPPAQYYEGYGQLENGVGMVRSFLDEWQEAFDEWRASPEVSKWQQGETVVSCVTGRLFGGILQNCAQELHRAAPGISLNVYPIRNDFFGEDITVAGLVTATDILKQLADRELGDHLILPDVMLRNGEEVFLDDYTVSAVSQSLQIDVVIVKSDGKSFFQGIFQKMTE